MRGISNRQHGRGGWDSEIALVIGVLVPVTVNMGGEDGTVKRQYRMEGWNSVLA